MSKSSKQKSTFHFPEVRVVEASAGSGKTYALAKRYTQLVLQTFHNQNQIPIKNILAITFTNKAAFEMKSRILEFLKMIAFKKLSKIEVQDILLPIGLTEDQASERAFGIMERIVRHYNFFQVQTIDKFINALLSGCAFKIGLTANFQIKTNTYDYLEYSLDDLIDNAQTDRSVEALFREFLHHYLYLENRSGWFPKQDMLSILVSLFGQNSSYGLPFQKSVYESKDLIKKKLVLVEDIAVLKEILPEKTNKGFLKSIDTFLQNSPKGFDIDSVSDYFAREEAPLNKGVDEPANLRKQWKKIGKDIKVLCEQEAYCLFDPYIIVFNEVMNGFYKSAQRDDCLFLSELNKQASKLFDEEYVTVDELYYRLATRFYHYLIDEFQDTSRLQWHNLEKMVEEALSTGGSLFYVGDRKQAIYSFRGGDARLFDDVKKRFNAFNVMTDMLVQNWRSQKAVVEVNNAIFSIENLKAFLEAKHVYEKEKSKKNIVEFDSEDLNSLDAVFKSSRQHYQQKNDRGYVKIEYVDIEKKEERDEFVRERVLERIKDLNKRFAYKDIALLTRSNSEVEQLTNWLLEEGIPVESERTSNIVENPLIEEIICFLRFLNSPIDNLSFAQFVLGDVFGLVTGLNREDMHQFIFSLRSQLKESDDFYLYRAFREKFQDVWDEYIDEFFKNVGLYPLYELVVSIYKKFKCLENFSHAQGFWMHLLELIKEHEDECFDVQDFIEYFENLIGDELFVKVTDYDAVKILTVHKAKGLEFPVVIVPFLGMDIQIGTGADNKQSYVLKYEDESMKLLKLKAKYYQFSDDLKVIYDQEYKKALLSEINNMYVALTRAEYELYVFIPQKIGNGFNYAQLLIPEECYQKGSQIDYKISEEKRMPIEILPPAKYHDWLDYLKEEFDDENKLSLRKSRLEGEIYHFILSCIGDLSKEDKEKSLKSAIDQVRTKFIDVDDFDAYVKQIDNLISKDDLRSFFYIEEGDVFTEKEVINSYGVTRRIDRLIIKENEVWIVDFKSSKENNEAYYAQVNEYKELLREIYSDKEILGFLLYLDCKEIEKVE